jgi:ribosomal protein L32
MNNAKSTEILSQDEIDQLLTAINAGEEVGAEFAPAKPRDPDAAYLKGNSTPIKNLDDLSKYLLERKTPEDTYGLFSHDVTTLNFFDDKNSEKILSDIEAKNKAQNMGNRKIPGTNIKLINYSYCPKCGEVYSMYELTEYYAHPKHDAQFKNLAEQYRQDTRICCRQCGEYFLPSLIITDGTPKNQVQHLCRVQIIHALESFYKEMFKKNVLTTNKRNIVQYENTKNIWNDVLLEELTPKPTLVSNLLQYSPANCIINLVEGVNIKKGDFLFGGWGGSNYEDYWK